MARTVNASGASDGYSGQAVAEAAEIFGADAQGLGARRQADRAVDIACRESSRSQVTVDW
jgi:hypothetical protein